MSVAFLVPSRGVGMPATGALIAGGLLVVSGVAAGAVALVGPATGREWLGFSFTTLPREVGEFMSILANNLMILGAVLAACFTVQVWAGSDTDDEQASGWAPRLMVSLCDLAVAGSAVGHALIIGLGSGAYGATFVSKLLPHGPFELMALALALALYMSARSRPVSRDEWIGVAAVSAALLAIAAPLEVYAAL